MKTIFNAILILILISVCNVSYAERKLTLSTSNHVVLRGSIDEENVNDVIYKIASHPNKSLYLYINSPGGSIHAGNTMINFLKSTDKQVYCVADYAASMAFSILQYCYKRIASSNSILMQHEAYIKLDDSVSNFMSMLKWLQDMIRHTEAGVAKRLDMPIKKYKHKIAGDWWIYGKHTVSEGVVDEIRLVSCTNKLIKQKEDAPSTISLGLFSTPLDVPSTQKSKCPIISPYVDDAELKNRGDWDATYIKKINRYTP